MADRGGYGIRDIGLSGRGSASHEPQHHGLDLFFFGATVASHRLFDRRRAVLENPHPGQAQNRENNSASMGEKERRSCAGPVEGGLDRGFRRRVLLDNGRHPCVQAGKPFG